MVSPGTILVSPPVPVQGIPHITAIVGYLGQRYSYQDWLLGQSLSCAQVHEREQFSIVLVFTVKLYSQYTSKRELGNI